MDNKINWKQKLTSRKFWALIVGFITPLLLSFGIAESTVSQTTAIVMAGGAVIAYILGEGFADGKREQTTNYGSEDSFYDSMEYYDSDTTTVTDGENVSEITTTAESIASTIMENL